jgi:hypothetical protein
MDAERAFGPAQRHDSNTFLRRSTSPLRLCASLSPPCKEDYAEHQRGYDRNDYKSQDNRFYRALGAGQHEGIIPTKLLSRFRKFFSHGLDDAVSQMRVRARLRIRGLRGLLLE